MQPLQSNDESKKSIESIKALLVKIFQNEKIKDIPNDDFTLEQNTEFSELGHDHKIRFLIPFVCGVAKEDKNQLTTYIENCLQTSLFESSDQESSNLIGTSVEMGVYAMKQEINKSGNMRYVFDPVKVYECVKAGEIGRNDKIFLNNNLKEFSIGFVDWEDAEFLETLAKACFYRSLLCLKSILNEENIKKSADEDTRLEESPSMKVFKMMKCGHLNPVEPDRKTLLQRRIKPTKSIDEYVESVMADMKKREAKKNDSDKPKEDELQDLRKKDEFDEFRRNFRGNTKGMG